MRRLKPVNTGSQKHVTETIDNVYLTDILSMLKR